MTREPTTTLRVCVDCLMMLANGELGQGDDVAEAAHDAAMGHALSGIEDVTLGCLDVECEDDGEECGFSWSRCDGCGSMLGGDRYHATGWVTS